MGQNARNCSWERFLGCVHGTLDHQDTISRMPEDVLQHIISFLPSSYKDDIRFLSRKWRRLSAQNQKTLSLTGLRLNDQDLNTILRGDFPSVEFLRLRNCSVMGKLRLENFKLKNLNLNTCESLNNLHLNTPHLETFYFHGPRLRPCTIEFVSCNHLRVLHLVGIAMETMMFIDCNKSFPILQVLTLSDIDVTGSINISSDSLQSLFLLNFQNNVDITVDAPNLLYFGYSGSALPFSNMNLPKLDLARIDLSTSQYEEGDEMWFTRLLIMLKCLKYTKRLELHTNFSKNIIIPKELRETHVPPLDEIYCIVVYTSSTTTDIVDLADGILWISPRVKNLHCHSELCVLEMEHRGLLGIHEKPCRFCASHPLRCWRHSVVRYMVSHILDDAEMEMEMYIRENLQYIGRYDVEQVPLDMGGVSNSLNDA